MAFLGELAYFISAIISVTKSAALIGYRQRSYAWPAHIYIISARFFLVATPYKTLPPGIPLKQFGSCASISLMSSIHLLCKPRAGFPVKHYDVTVGNSLRKRLSLCRFGAAHSTVVKNAVPI